MTHFVFIDLNGTLISEDAINTELNDQILRSLRDAIARLQKSSVQVGLCSDSPLSNLRKVSQYLSMTEDAPIVAENGNLVEFLQNKIVIRRLTDELRQHICAVIGEVGSDLGLVQHPDVDSVEFTGEEIGYKDCWAFGAGRETSISIFGPDEFLNTVAEKIRSSTFANGETIGIDLALECQFLGFHPIDDFSLAKSRSLDWLKQNGPKLGVSIDSIWLIGNSNSDVMRSGDPQVHTVLVADHRVSPELLSKATYVSELPNSQGVIDSLEFISRQLNREISRVV